MPQYDKLQIYFNGEFEPLSEARLSIFDHGVMLGDMVYEMTRTFAHKPFMLDAHLDRLMASCRFTGINPGLSRQEVEEVSLRLLALNEPFVEPEVDLFIRHDISRGTMAHYERCVLPPQKPTAPGQATVIIACIPLIEYLGRAAAYFDGGLHAVVPPQQAIPARYLDPKCKTRSRLHYQMANLQARRLDPEAWAVMVDEHGHIAEGTSSNFHIVKNGAIYTSQGRNVLRGCSRQYVARLADQLGIPCHEANIEPYDVLNADEAFFTASSYCLCPATRFNFQPIGDGQVGPVVKSLLRQWSENVGVDLVAQAKLMAEQYC
ncbi:aminotransferase class IV [bacterium]|nr:aminotransferase class IV [bacterium]